MSESTYYAVSREPGRGWASTAPMRQQVRWDEHAVFMNKLESDGRIVLGGPVDDAGKVLLIVRTVDEQEVHALLANEPSLGWKTRSGVARFPSGVHSSRRPSD